MVALNRDPATRVNHVDDVACHILAGIHPWTEQHELVGTNACARAQHRQLVVETTPQEPYAHNAASSPTYDILERNLKVGNLFIHGELDGLDALLRGRRPPVV